MRSKAYRKYAESKHTRNCTDKLSLMIQKCDLNSVIKINKCMVDTISHNIR